MSKRIITGVIGFPLLVAVTYAGGYVLWTVMLVLSLIGLREIYTAMSGKYDHVHLVGYVFTIIYYLTLNNLSSTILLIINSMFAVTLMVMLVIFHPKLSIDECGVVLFGFYYVPELLSFIYLVRENYYGIFFVWLIYICAFGSDTFAYFIGILLGKHKLAPNLSPKKTIEGSIGGAVGSALLAFIFGLIISKYSNFHDIRVVTSCLIIGIIGAVFAQFGDLAASAIKRRKNIKDFGHVIPGHGGILDRFDSVMFTAPVVYFVMYFFTVYIRKQ